MIGGAATPGNANYMTRAGYETLSSMFPIMHLYGVCPSDPKILGVLTDLCSCRLVDLLSIYLRRVLTEVFDADPDSWIRQSRTKLHVRDFIDFTREELIQRLRESEPKDIAESRQGELTKKLNNVLKFELLTEAQSLELARLRNKRNTIVHNGGVADEAYVAEARRCGEEAAVGDLVAFDMHSGMLTILVLLSLLVAVDARVIEQYPALAALDSTELAQKLGEEAAAIMSTLSLSELSPEENQAISEVYQEVLGSKAGQMFPVGPGEPPFLLGALNGEIWHATQMADGGWLVLSTSFQAGGVFEDKAAAVAAFKAALLAEQSGAEPTATGDN